MRVPKRLGEARKIIEEHTGDVEDLIQQKLDEFRNLDIQGIVRKQDQFEEITTELSEQEKQQFEKEFEELAEDHSGLINAVADSLSDPKTREAIIEELKRRVRG